ncbi:MAG: winged helix-turn-helix domain-containing protein [Methanobacteriota archaeon]|nr:MAG: winged helix-turn-helix domain-containing protein [Euryarchaeota archaeon]
MSETVITTSLECARRLAVTKQHLAGKVPTGPATEMIVSVIRDLGFVQWDPVDVVAPSHLITLWSRVGKFRMSDLDRLLWDDKKLFEHWSHAASIVLTEDYPLFYSLMKRYPESLSKSWGGWKARARKWLAENKGLRKKILNELGKGPLRLSEFEDHARGKRSADGWTSGSDVSTALFHMQMSGDVMVVGHEGRQNIWGLSETFLPSWVARNELPEQEVEREGAERTIRALGTASPSEINRYFLRGRYLDLKKALERLQEESTVHRVHVTGLGGERYIHDRDVQLLESMNSRVWQPRMSLLAPFDNLLAVREGTSRLFGFDYVHENFLPKNKRKFGTYVLPILWGDRFIGRVDPKMDRENERLVINSIHAEPGAPRDKEVALKIRETIENLAEFLGAKEVEYTARVPKAWRNSLR